MQDTKPSQYSKKYLVNVTKIYSDQLKNSVIIFAQRLLLHATKDDLSGYDLVI